jgi:quercetin dioxygenase-like cupin family protein
VPIAYWLRQRDLKPVAAFRKRRWHEKSGERILMPAGEPHALKAAQKFKMLLAMIKSQEEIMKF